MLNERNLILLEFIACEMSFDQVRIQAKSVPCCREAQPYTGETFITIITYFGGQIQILSKHYNALRSNL